MKYLSLLITALLLLSSCVNETLEEINIDPTRLSEVRMSLMLPEIQSQLAYNKGAVLARMAGAIMQQFAHFDAKVGSNPSVYRIGADALNNDWGNGLYAGSLRSAQVLIEKANKTDAPFYRGVGKILLASEYGLATSYFGDIPFSDALKGNEELTPAYDAQEDVYSGIQDLLDAAILDLSAGKGYGGGDLIYDGDAEAWIKVAYALKARYLMHLVKRDAESVVPEALSALGNTFTSLEDQPDFLFGVTESDNYSLAKFGLERPNTIVIHDHFVEVMSDDPRQDAYMTYDGSIWYYWDSENTSLAWAQNDAIIPLMSYVEVKFLEAETMARSGMDASEALKEGITASMIQAGATDYEAYVMQKSNLSGLSGEEILQRIIEEAYKAYYGYNFSEIWSNYGRTRYPELVPNPDGMHALNPSGGIPERFLYVTSEQQTNFENLEAARAAQNGALLDVPVWAFR